MSIKRSNLRIPGDPTPFALVTPNSDKSWAVLWLQGWTSSIEGHLEGISRMTQATNTSFAMIDYAGHGNHSIGINESTKQMQLIEVVAAYDELKQHGYQNIIVIGGSFGGYMAALLGQERELAAIVLRAPAIYPDDEFSLNYSQTKRYEDDGAYKKFYENNELHSNNRAFQAIKKYQGPVYVLEHELDSIIPPEIPQTYFKNAMHGNYIRIPNTDHSPKFMPNPQKHYIYIEHILASIIIALRLTP
jgi:esterase/lipase